MTVTSLPEATPQPDPDPGALELVLAPADLADRGWVRWAACRFVEDPELFFSDDPDDVAVATAYCAICPVRAYCAAELAADEKRVGTWAGIHVDVDVELRQHPECGTTDGYNKHRRLREQICLDCNGAYNQARKGRGEGRKYGPRQCLRDGCKNTAAKGRQYCDPECRRARKRAVRKAARVARREARAAA